MKIQDRVGIEPLESRCLFNAAPIIGETVAVSVSLARHTPNGEAVSWSYDELLQKSKAYDADNDQIVFYVSFIENIPSNMGEVSNGDDRLTANFAPTSLEPDSPYFIKPGETLNFTPIMYGRASMPILVNAFDGSLLSSRFFLATFTDLGSPGGGGKAGNPGGGSGGSGGSGGGSGSGGSTGGTSGGSSGGSSGGTSGGTTEVPLPPFINLPVTFDITKQNRGVDLSFEDLIALTGVSNADLATGTLSLSRLSNGVALVNGQPATTGIKLKAGDTLRWQTSENRTLMDAFTVRLTPKKGAPIDTPFRVRQPNFWDPGVGPFQIPEGRAVSGVTDAAGFEIRAWRNEQNEGLLEIRAPRDPVTDLPGELRQYDLSQSFQVLPLFADPVVHRSTIDNRILLILSLQDGGTAVRTLSVNADLSVSLGDNLLTPSVVGASSRYSQILPLPLAGETDRTIIAARDEFTGAITVFAERAAGQTRTWSGVDVADALFNNNQPAITLVGKMIGYRTPWGGWNLAGLDSTGKLRTIWTGSADGAVYTSDLSRISNGPKFAGGLSAYITPWNGINVTAQTADGSLLVTWWVPAFGGTWVISNFSELFGGARLTSVVSYTTSWNALNIVGVDDAGRIRVYWWEPTRAGDPVRDVWSLDTLAPAGFRKGAALSVSFDQASGQIRIYGTSETEDRPTSLRWEPGNAGRWNFDEA